MERHTFSNADCRHPLLQPHFHRPPKNHRRLRRHNPFNGSLLFHVHTAHMEQRAPGKKQRLRLNTHGHWSNNHPLPGADKPERRRRNNPPGNRNPASRQLLRAAGARQSQLTHNNVCAQRPFRNFHTFISDDF